MQNWFQIGGKCLLRFFILQHTYFRLFNDKFWRKLSQLNQWKYNVVKAKQVIYTLWKFPRNGIHFPLFKLILISYMDEKGPEMFKNIALGN